MDKLKSWFKKRNKWVQHAVNHLIEFGALSAKNVEELASLIIDEAKGVDLEDISIKKVSFDLITSREVALLSISDVVGVNALAPTKALEFGDKNLAIVYGRNGSGKSGYVKILKHLTGSRNPGELLGNVYEKTPSDQKCTVTYSVDGEEKKLEWNKESGPVDDLLSIDVYDSTTGLVYLEGQNEVTYEPPLLRFFSELIDISQVLGDFINSKIDEKISAKPEIPLKYQETESGKWYQNLSFELNDEKINKRAYWNEEDESRLKTLSDSLSDISPSKTADKLLKRRKDTFNLVSDTLVDVKKLSDKNIFYLISLKEQLKNKREASEEAANKLFSSSPLEGIGTKVWEELWKKAKEYSEQIVYDETEFPFIGEGARCVLCQQELSDEAKNRFTSFQEYITTTLNTEIEEISASIKKLIEDSTDLPNQEFLLTKLDAIGIEDEMQCNVVKSSSYINL